MAQPNDRIEAARLSVWPSMPSFMTSLNTVEKGTALPVKYSHSTTETVPTVSSTLHDADLYPLKALELEPLHCTATIPRI